MLLAGPFTGRLLGDMGAEIIKVEPPGQPDPLRDWGHARYEGRSLWWPVQSRNKKCVHAQPARASGARSCCSSWSSRATSWSRTSGRARSSAGTSAPERLWEANPGLVIARVSGYGQTGPYAPRAGFASGRRGDGRDPLHQRLPGRAAAAHPHLARRLARRHVRGAGHPRRALPARRPRRRPRPGRRRLADGGLLRAAREHGPRVRPARDRPRPGRHGPEGRRARRTSSSRATASGS